MQAGVTSRARSEGYWIILQPLTRGIHQLRFGGEAYVMDTLEFKTDVTYHLPCKIVIANRLHDFLETKYKIEKIMTNLGTDRKP